MLREILFKWVCFPEPLGCPDWVKFIIMPAEKKSVMVTVWTKFTVYWWPVWWGGSVEYLLTFPRHLLLCGHVFPTGMRMTANKARLENMLFRHYSSLSLLTHARLLCSLFALWHKWLKQLLDVWRSWTWRRILFIIFTFQESLKKKTERKISALRTSETTQTCLSLFFITFLIDVI